MGCARPRCPRGREPRTVVRPPFDETLPTPPQAASARYPPRVPKTLGARSPAGQREDAVAQRTVHLALWLISPAPASGLARGASDGPYSEPEALSRTISGRQRGRCSTTRPNGQRAGPANSTPWSSAPGSPASTGSTACATGSACPCRCWRRARASARLVLEPLSRARSNSKATPIAYYFSEELSASWRSRRPAQKRLGGGAARARGQLFASTCPRHGDQDAWAQRLLERAASRSRWIWRPEQDCAWPAGLLALAQPQ